MVVNARSLVNKRDEIELIAEQEDYSIGGITETWLTSSKEYAEVELEGYKIFRTDRVSPIKTPVGGVLSYIKENMNIVHGDDIVVPSFLRVYLALSKAMVRTLLDIC